MRFSRLALLGKRDALSLLRQGTSHAISSSGLEATSEALTVLGHWDELRRLAEESKAQSQSLAPPLALALVSDKRASTEQLLDLLGRVDASARPALLEKAASVHRGAAELLLAFARDEMIEVFFGNFFFFSFSYDPFSLCRSVRSWRMQLQRAVLARSAGPICWQRWPRITG